MASIAKCLSFGCYPEEVNPGRFAARHRAYLNHPTVAEGMNSSNEQRLTLVNLAVSCCHYYSDVRRHWHFLMATNRLEAGHYQIIISCLVSFWQPPAGKANDGM